MDIRKRSFLGLALGLIASTALSPVAFAQDGSVVIYTAHKASIVDTLLPLFEAETGLKAEVVKLGSSDVFKRARAEAGAPAADVIWSVTGSQLTENKDLLEAYQPADFDKVDTQFVGDPSWTPYTAVVYVLTVNTDALPLDQAPKTWAELTDPKWKGQIASARADGSGSAMQQLQTVLTVFGDQGWDKYKEIASNFVFADSSGAVPRYVADGEASMGLTLEDNALEYVKGGAPMLSFISPMALRLRPMAWLWSRAGRILMAARSSSTGPCPSRRRISWLQTSVAVRCARMWQARKARPICQSSS